MCVCVNAWFNYGEARMFSLFRCLAVGIIDKQYQLQLLPWLKPLLQGFSGWGQISQQVARQIQSLPKLCPEEKCQGQHIVSEWTASNQRNKDIYLLCTPCLHNETESMQPTLCSIEKTHCRVGLYSCNKTFIIQYDYLKRIKLFIFSYLFNTETHVYASEMSAPRTKS